MSLHKLTAGSGYDYLTRQVAALDATEKGHTGLASYYTERGESPGVWIGSGMDGIDGLAAGDPVTAEQMRALFGCGLHPLASSGSSSWKDRPSPNGTTRTRSGSGRRSGSLMVSSARSAWKWRNASGRSIRQPACRPMRRCRLRIGRGCGTELAREFFLAEHGREPMDARELAGQIAKDSRPRTQTVAGMT